MIVITRSVPQPLNRDAQRLQAVVVDRWLAAADLCECAMTLVTPRQLGERSAA